ncbi:uncharacterized protein LOC103106510 [Monodelphis domestica]|uniref:uncharacterized protein LOC103106510 n=1 Tax=Monodelphis domestica TaxID=13616 RepID=UPI0024E210F8|nr:uncharacterized protein LOC103106510 [Monodelphis domestica]
MVLITKYTRTAALTTISTNRARWVIGLSRGLGDTDSPPPPTSAGPAPGLLPLPLSPACPEGNSVRLLPGRPDPAAVAEPEARGGSGGREGGREASGDNGREMSEAAPSRNSSSSSSEDSCPLSASSSAAERKRRQQQQQWRREACIIPAPPAHHVAVASPVGPALAQARAPRGTMGAAEKEEDAKEEEPAAEARPGPVGEPEVCTSPETPWLLGTLLVAIKWRRGRERKEGGALKERRCPLAVT